MKQKKKKTHTITVNANNVSNIILKSVVEQWKLKI